jgi:hypothetical protein
MFCTRCGSSNQDEAQFCRRCGESIIKPGASRPQTEEVSYTLPRFSQPPAYQPYQGYQSNLPAPPATAGASGRAVASMILTLVSLFTCGPFLSIPGLILGKLELGAIERGLASPAGSTFAKIGYYGGIAVTLLSCLGGIVYFFVMLATGVLNIS